MYEMEVSISSAAPEPSDLTIQNELRYIYEELASFNPQLTPLKQDVMEDSSTKSGDIDIIIGSITIIIPSAVFVSVFSSLIKNYFDARKGRGIQIKKKNGVTIQIHGYNAQESEKLLLSLIESDLLKPTYNHKAHINQ
jgi:hypothetical protein